MIIIFDNIVDIGFFDLEWVKGNYNLDINILFFINNFKNIIVIVFGGVFCRFLKLKEWCVWYIKIVFKR